MTDKLTEADFNEVDREALNRSLQIILNGKDEGRAEQVRAFMTESDADPAYGWWYAASFCASLCQDRALGLKPWQSPPWDADEDGHADEERLLKRMLSHGVSRYEPDPLTAINAKGK